MHLNQIVERIDDAFGDEPPFTAGGLSAGDQEVLGRVFGDSGYQHYLQDQVNRQIIRDYLTNAVILGHLPEEDLERLTRLAGTSEGRSSLSLHMLMSSVEQAAELAVAPPPNKLEKLSPGQDSPPYMRLVRS